VVAYAVNGVIMKYTNTDLGFSFELPAGWQEQPRVIPPTFTSDFGMIQIKATTAKPSFSTPAQRKAFMAEPGFEFLDDASFGDESENVLHLRDMKNNQGWLSAVRDGIHYELSWDPYDRPEMQSAVSQAASSFVFPNHKTAEAAVAHAQQMGPAQKALADIVYGPNRGSSVEDAVERLRQGGMVPIGEGRTGTFCGFPNEILTSRKFRTPVGTFWYVVTSIAGMYWGISFVSGGAMSRSLIWFAPPLLAVLTAFVAVGRFDLRRGLVGAVTLYFTFLIGLATGYVLSVTGIIRFFYSPTEG